LRAHHIALRVADPERAAAFYSGVLGLEKLRRQPEAGPPRSIWLALGEAILMLETGLSGAGAAEGSAHLLALAVDDLAVWEERLAAAGVALTGRSQWTLYCNDPDGHRVALSCYQAPAPASVSEG
jgi:catechol 2,3-dioxygenase-like lactoylglutathione lyase family enzyme